MYVYIFYCDLRKDRGGTAENTPSKASPAINYASKCRGPLLTISEINTSVYRQAHIYIPSNT